LREGVFVWDQQADGQRTRRGYARSGLGPADVERIARELVAHLEAERAYLDPELRHAEVAAALSVSPNHLSQALHQSLGTTFNDLINRYRLEEVQRRLADPANRDRKVLDIVRESGFASKPSFYRIFKEATGITPTEYQARLDRG
jgi:AraC-like DNA-binding protein